MIGMTAEQREILRRLIEMFDLPQNLKSLEIKWNEAEALTVNCTFQPSRVNIDNFNDTSPD